MQENIPHCNFSKWEKGEHRSQQQQQQLQHQHKHHLQRHQQRHRGETEKFSNSLLHTNSNPHQSNNDKIQLIKSLHMELELFALTFLKFFPCTR